MDTNFKLYDLKVVLGAIKEVRKKWLEAYRVKLAEIIEDKPGISFSEAQSEALTHPDINQAYMPLITLYGIVGEGADAYEAAVSSVVVESEDLVERKAA